MPQLERDAKKKKKKMQEKNIFVLFKHELEEETKVRAHLGSKTKLKIKKIWNTSKSNRNNGLKQKTSCSLPIHFLGCVCGQRTDAHFHRGLNKREKKKKKKKNSVCS